MKSRFTFKFTKATILLSVLIFSFVLPIQAFAAFDAILEDPDPCLVNNGVGETAVRAMDVTAITTNTAISVPVNDLAGNKILSDQKSIACAAKKATKAQKDKVVGKTFLGIPVPFTSWDAIGKAAMKVIVVKLTADTVKWINTGFDGNPMFVQDPGKFFGDTANGLAENFIDRPDSPLQFLCAPFADKVRISLANSYYQTTTYNPTCTFTGIQGNLEEFYNKFSSGGWDAWFSMTQNPNNNPYDSYLNAKIELDSQIASALHIKEEQLRWGSGFLSFDVCPEGMKVTGSADDQQYRDSGYNAGDCLGEKITRTPGVVIEKQLQGVLGQGVTDIGLARSFDDLVSALIGALAKKVFNSAAGLLSGGNNSGDGYVGSGRGAGYDVPQGGSGGGATNPAPSVVCSASTDFVVKGNPVTWTAAGAQTSGVTVSYSWDGEDIVGENGGTSVTTIYSTDGEKKMSLNVTSTRAASRDIPESTQTSIVSCGSVIVSN